MKLLATDYDGTFKSDLKNLYLNKKAVKEFMDNGNKFAIVTGRDFKSMKEEVNNYDIEYDYLSCNNGLIVYDNKDNIIDLSVMSEENIIFIHNFLACSFDIKFLRLFNVNSPLTEPKQILEIFVSFKNTAAAIEHKKYLESTFPNIRCYRIDNKLFISNNRTKADAVSFIQQLENIDLNDVYTVGDDTNDLEMLKKFNGYKILTSYPSLWLKPLPITREVHTLIKKINK